jgi:hypothetical protein
MEVKLLVLEMNENFNLVKTLKVCHICMYINSTDFMDYVKQWDAFVTVLFNKYL